MILNFDDFALWLRAQDPARTVDALSRGLPVSYCCPVAEWLTHRTGSPAEARNRHWQQVSVDGRSWKMYDDVRFTSFIEKFDNQRLWYNSGSASCWSMGQAQYVLRRVEGQI